MPNRRRSTPVICECGARISRQADLPRHQRSHATDRVNFMWHCPFRVYGCEYEALQKSNLKTHLNIHFRRQPNKCPEQGCAFATSDSACLTHHRKALHGYDPKGSSRNRAETNRKTTRQQRRYTPYTPSSSNSCSDPDSPGSYYSLINYLIDAANKDRCATPSDELVAKLEQLDKRDLILNTRKSSKKDDPPLNSTVPENPQLPVPAQGNSCATFPTVQPVCEMTVSEEVFDNFLAKFGDWQSAATSPSTSFDDATPAALSPDAVDDAVILPPAVPSPYEDQHNVLLPMPTSAPSYEVRLPGNSTPYEYYDYTPEMASFDAQYSEPDWFAIPDEGVFPRAFYPQDIDLGRFDAISAGTSGYAMQGLCLY